MPAHGPWLGIAVALACASSACKNGSAAEARPGWYRAVLELDPAARAEVPFFLYLPADGEAGVLLNDRERVPIDHSWHGGTVDIKLRDYQWTIRAALDGNELVGHLLATHPVYRGELRDGETQFSIPLRARQVPRADPDARFALPGSSEPPADFSGSWRIVPESPLDHSSATDVVYKALVEQQSGQVRGDLIIDTGDLRYLAGNARGTSMALAAIDGSHFALLRATLDGPDHLTGELFVMRERTRIVGERRSSIAFSDIQRPLDALDLQGWKVPALDQPPYRGKPVIVEVFGTWCSNCNDAAPLLRTLYDTYHPQGLEMLGLSVEFTDDRAYAQRLVDGYARRHRIRWQLVPIVGDEELDGLLTPFRAYSFAVPIILFLRRDGSLAGAHRGFIGPTGGADRDALRARLEQLTRSIVQPVAP